jgi:hypothetical protein
MGDIISKARCRDGAYEEKYQSVLENAACFFDDVSIYIVFIWFLYNGMLQLHYSWRCFLVFI